MCVKYDTWYVLWVLVRAHRQGPTFSGGGYTVVFTGVARPNPRRAERYLMEMFATCFEE